MGLEEYWLIGLTIGLGALGGLQALTMFPRPYGFRRWIGGRIIDHKHEYGHNPGDGYFYCTVGGSRECQARKRLGGI